MCEHHRVCEPHFVFDDRCSEPRRRKPNHLLHQQRLRQLRQWIAEDPDPRKRTALRYWRDDVIHRLQPHRKGFKKLCWQIARIPEIFLPYVKTVNGKVVFGPQNEVYALLTYDHRSCYRMNEEPVVPPEVYQVQPDHEIALGHHSE